jgi:transcriptional regulator with XRE-family HTH domain
MLQMTEKPIATFAERLREAMKSREIPAAELARQTDISTAAISRYLRGDYEPKQDKLIAIAKALRVNAGWLMGYDIPYERAKSPKAIFAVDDDLRADVGVLDTYKNLLTRTDDLGKAFRTFATAVAKEFNNTDFDTMLLKKFHALSPEHQTMVTGMINGFYYEDIGKQKNAPSVDGEGDSGTQKVAPSLQ